MHVMIPTFLQVFQRLQKAGICLSHSSTVKLVDKLGVHYNSEVMQWKQNTEAKIAAMKVNIEKSACTLNV